MKNLTLLVLVIFAGLLLQACSKKEEPKIVGENHRI